MKLPLSGVLLRQLESRGAISGRRVDMAPRFRANVAVALTKDANGNVVPVMGPDRMPVFLWPKPRTGRAQGTFDWTPTRRQTLDSPGFKAWFQDAWREYENTGDVRHLYAVRGRPSAMYMPDTSDLAPGAVATPPEFAGGERPDVPRETRRGDAPTRPGGEPSDLEGVRANIQRTAPDGWSTMPNEGNIRLSDGVVELPDGRRFSPGQPEWLATIERNYDADLVLAGIEGDDVPDVVHRALAGEPVEPVERVADVADDAPRAPSPAPERAPAPDPLPEPDAPRASMPEKPMDRATRTALDRYRAAVNPEHYGDVTPTGAQGLFPKPGAFGPTTVEEATPRRRTARVAGIGAIGGLGLGTALGFYLDQRRNKSREDAPVEMAAFRLNMAAPEIEARYQVEAEKLFDDMLGRPREMIQSEVDDLNVILGTTTLSDVQRAEYERQRIERFRELKAARRKWSRIPSKVSDEDAILYHWELAQEQARENVDAQVAGELREAQARSQPQEQPRSVRQRRPDPPVSPAPAVEAPAPVQAPDPVPDPVPESSPDTPTRRFRGWKGTAVSTVGGLGLGVIMGKMLTNRNQGEQMADARYDMAPIDPIPQGTYKPGTGNAPTQRTEEWNLSVCPPGVVPRVHQGAG